MLGLISCRWKIFCPRSAHSLVCVGDLEKTDRFDLKELEQTRALSEADSQIQTGLQLITDTLPEC